MPAMNPHSFLFYYQGGKITQHHHPSIIIFSLILPFFLCFLCLSSTFQYTVQYFFFTASPITCVFPSPSQTSVAWRRRAAIHPDLCLFLPFKPEQARLMPLPHFSVALLYRLCSRQLLYFPRYPSFSYFSPPNSLPLSLLLCLFQLHFYCFLLLLPFSFPSLMFPFFNFFYLLYPSLAIAFSISFPSCIKKNQKKKTRGALDEKSVALSRGGHTPLR